MRWLWRLLLVLAVGVGLLAAPVVWVETACRAPVVAAQDYRPVITDPAERRAESRTLLTYPEWHIVHAYDDYAQVITAGDPHDFGYLRGIAGFWTSLCALSEAAGAHGGVTAQSKQTIYTIGVSFTLEMALKAAYEETLGRVATWIRGETRAPLDDLRAAQAAAYAAFLQQVPWYRWDFAADVVALAAANTGSFRDWERRVAIGLEFGAKGLYARAIEAAVAGVGADELTIRSIVTGLSPEALAGLEGVEVIAERPEGIEIETPRYRAFTRILERLAAEGAEIVEIAGNDEIMLTATSDVASYPGALASFPRQGYGDWRHLILLPLDRLALTLRSFGGDIRLEHVHDY